MNNFIKIILFFIFIANCSLQKNSKFWTTKKIEKEKQENLTIIFKKEENLIKEFNSNLKISLYAKKLDKSFLNNFDNNNGRIDLNSNFQSILKYKFSKIKNFFQYDPSISFYKNDIIFFDKSGSILRFNNDTDLVWKKNNYTKSEKKQSPILFFANNKKTLVVADTISKYYALNIKTGKILWSKNNVAPFNSQLKIYKDKFFIVDFENTLRAYSVVNGNEVWKVKTQKPLIRSQKKLSLVIIEGKIYFNNSSGDISSVDIETGELLWQTPTQSSLIYEETFFLKTSDIIADNQTLYFSNNKKQFFSLDIQTGTLNWTQKINSSLRPTLIDNYIFTVTNKGYLVVIDKNSGNIVRITDSFKNFKNKKRDKIKPTGFIIGDNSIYLTTDHGRLIVLDVVTGEVINIMKIDNDKISRPSVLNKKIFIINDSSIIKLN